jgi:pimeloyl-ACP methyl ester carboxylesterase
MKRWIRSWCVVALAGALCACAMVKLGTDSKAFYASTVLVGRVECPTGCVGPVVVAALQPQGDRVDVAHRTLLHEPGGYELIVAKGEYALFAFGDNNRNGIYEAGEPAAQTVGTTPVVATGSGVVASLDLVLSGSPSGRLAVPIGTSFDAAFAKHHSTQAGALADLADARFSAENGTRGYWAPMEFFRDTGGNVYFLEPFDPNKIPILFVHGAAGSPQDWRYFFDHIDRRRYQPWFFQYPSGAAVDSMAYLLYWKLLNLQLRYRFDKLYITAHSMGGLVVRDLLLNHGAQFPQIKLFVSLSTPWAGEASADLGVNHSPAVVPSWRDMQPEGRFMKALFARRLPAHVDHYLLFGHKGGYSMLRPNNDGTVTLASQLRSPAQAEAKMVYGFDEDHVSILSSPQVVAQYQALLSGAEKPVGDEPRSGRLRVSFSIDGSDDAPQGLPLLLLKPVGDTLLQPRAPVTIPLSSTDSGRELGPIAPGAYDASLVVASFKSEPHSVRLQIESGVASELSFRLVPQGTLSGYVGADSDSIGSPAGSYRPPNDAVRITSIVLEGAGIRRMLVPRRTGADDMLERYARGEDSAYKSSFLFVGLPEGDYVLTILADGHRPFTSRHSVVPGRQAALMPVVLEPQR